MVTAVFLKRNALAQMWTVCPFENFYFMAELIFSEALIAFTSAHYRYHYRFINITYNLVWAKRNFFLENVKKILVSQKRIIADV